MNSQISLPSDSDIHALAYVSRATRHWTAHEAEILKQTCARNNEELGLTGRLLFCKGLFFQLMEGPAEAVVEKIHDIAMDDRHERVTSLFFVPAKRRYEDFRMMTTNVNRANYLDYARRCLEHIAGQGQEQARRTLSSALDYLAADEISRPSLASQVQRVPGVKLYARSPSDLPQATNFNPFTYPATVPLRLVGLPA